jgi:hypothetical protein
MATQVRQSSSLARYWTEAEYEHSIYSIFGRIYYKQDSNSTTSHIFQKRIEIPPIHRILYITKRIPFPSIDTSSGITKRIQQKSGFFLPWFLYMDFFTMVASQVRCFVSSDIWGLYEVSKEGISSNWLYYSSSTTTFSIPTIPPLSHLLTDAALLLHCSWVLSDFNYWALKLVTGVKCSSVTDFIARYQYRVISNW